MIKTIFFIFVPDYLYRFIFKAFDREEYEKHK